MIGAGSPAKEIHQVGTSQFGGVPGHELGTDVLLCLVGECLIGFGDSGITTSRRGRCIARSIVLFGLANVSEVVEVVARERRYGTVSGDPVWGKICLPALPALSVVVDSRTGADAIPAVPNAPPRRIPGVRETGVVLDVIVYVESVVNGLERECLRK